MQNCRKIQSEWDIIAAKQLGLEMLEKLPFNEIDQARILITVSELARNIYLYAEEGTICISEIHRDDRLGLAISATDNGPGISDINMVMKDGFSTSGGLGSGIPGAKRMMDEFHIKSEPGVGTEITAIKWVPLE